MSASQTVITGEHRTMLAIEVMNAAVVTLIVVAATIVYLLQPKGIPGDLLGFVYGGGITFAGGRAAQSRSALTRGRQDNGGPPTPSEP